MQTTHKRLGALTATTALTLALATSPASAADPANDRECHGQTIPVSLNEGGPEDQHVYAELCTPTGDAPEVVQFLIHGLTYDHTYFDQPGFDGAYSYAASANSNGYATLSIDRLGSGRSSHPLAASLGANNQSWVNHQIVDKLRSGDLETAHGKTAFSRVIGVGHSYGTGLLFVQATEHKDDLDGLILTGAAHFMRYDRIVTTLTPSLIPAALDPKFLGETLDPGYLTTRAGTRYQNFMDPGDVDPALIEQDEALKSKATATELAQLPLLIGTPLDIEEPVLLALGEKDPLFCGAGVTCESAEQLVQKEKPRLGENVPCAEGYLQPGAGHDNVLMRNASEFFDTLNSWSAQHVPADGSRAGC